MTAVTAVIPAATVVAPCTTLGGTADALLSRVSVRETLPSLLTDHDDVPVACRLAAHLGSADVGLGDAVGDVLISLPGVLHLWLPDLVTDTNPQVRIGTAMLLARLEPSVAVGWLREMIGTDTDPEVVATAITSLRPRVHLTDIILLEATIARFPRHPVLRATIGAVLQDQGQLHAQAA